MDLQPGAPTLLRLTPGSRSGNLVAGWRGLKTERPSVRIISYGKIRDFYALHPASQVSLDAWYDITAAAAWKTFAELRATFRSADVYGDCTIFDVGHNKYRLIAWLSYKTHKVFIRSVMTHAEYDQDKWKSDC